MKCANCGSERLYKNGICVKTHKQKYKCADCGSERRPVGGYTTVTKPRKTKKMGISTDELRKKHDVNYILSQVIEKFQDDTFYEKSDVIQMSGLRPGYPGMNTVLESDTFKKYCGRAGGKIYYAKEELIIKMKDEGILT